MHELNKFIYSSAEDEHHDLLPTYIIDTSKEIMESFSNA